MERAAEGGFVKGNCAPIRVTILLDNEVAADRGLVPEHGFSALIERVSDRILFDTGQGPGLVRNAGLLGKNLDNLSAVVLSHGHSDHTGGLAYVVDQNPGIEVVAHPKCLSRYVATPAGKAFSSSMRASPQQRSPESTKPHFRLTSEFEQIRDQAWFTGQVPRIFHGAWKGLRFLPVHRVLNRDIIEDDASLLLATASGYVLLLGCAHAGVRNILEWVREAKGIDEIHAVVGGTHLGFLDKSETTAVIDAFERFRVQCVATAHCTGAGPNRALKSHFGNRFSVAAAGTTWVF
jgi:7,8-dihydropterin-6-yl-methyl-4-(beta-D-ribofuranosyl)aminobenzene 5'-phosphate synthase